MGLPRVRLTVRRLMVIVAVVAVMFAMEQMYQHWSYCQRRSAYHDQRRAVFTALEDNGVVVLGSLNEQNGEERVNSLAESIQDHTRMREKYAGAAWHPWLPIEPDPTEPEL
jgi:hypothetical protein